MKIKGRLTEEQAKQMKGDFPADKFTPPQRVWSRCHVSSQNAPKATPKSNSAMGIMAKR